MLSVLRRPVIVSSLCRLSMLQSSILPARMPVLLPLSSGGTTAVAGASRWLHTTADRRAAATPKPTSEHESTHTTPTATSNISDLIKKGAIVTAVVLVSYGVAKVTWDLSTFTMGLSMFDLGEIGFYAGGLLTAGACVGIYILGRRWASLTPEQLTKHVMQELRRDAAVRNNLGDVLNQGRFTAYAYDPNHTLLRHLDMLFRVVGNHDAALVGVRAHKTWRGEITVDSLALNLQNGEKMLVLKGDVDKVILNNFRL